MLPDSSSRRTCAAGRLVAKIIALLVIHAAWSPLWADVPASSCSLPRPQDQVWLVSCRSLGCGPLEGQVTKMQYLRYDRRQSWVHASLPELLATDDPSMTTILFAHGNRITYEDAFTTGWNVYGALAQSADPRPIRFIIWSWPSEPLRGLVDDARVKAWRTGPAGYQMAWLIDQLNPQVPVSLCGHSFGARIATGALHLLGGGSIDGHRLEPRVHPDRQPVQAVLLAAALDNHWLLPGHYHGRAMSQVSTMFLVNNGCDMLLKRYHILYGDRGREQALGYTGLASWCVSSADLSKVSQIDVCCEVGKRHAIDGYLESPGLVARMRPHLIFGPSAEPIELPSQTAAISSDAPGTLAE